MKSNKYAVLDPGNYLERSVKCQRHGAWNSLRHLDSSIDYWTI